MRGAYIRYKPTRKGYDVITAEGKRGWIEKRRGAFRFIMTRNASDSELQAICHFVGELNKA